LRLSFRCRAGERGALAFFLLSLVASILLTGALNFIVGTFAIR
jgi:hypothetical protein